MPHDPRKSLLAQFSLRPPAHVPVPNARRVTLTLDFPKVTQSVALPPAANTGLNPLTANAPAVTAPCKNLRREQGVIGISFKRILSPTAINILHAMISPKCSVVTSSPPSPLPLSASTPKPSRTISPQSASSTVLKVAYSKAASPDLVIKTKAWQSSGPVRKPPSPVPAVPGRTAPIMEQSNAKNNSPARVALHPDGVLSKASFACVNSTRPCSFRAG